MAEAKTFTVVATQRGYLRSMRDAGDKFGVTAEQFSSAWMKPADEASAKGLKSAVAALEKAKAAEVKKVEGK